MNRHVTTGTLFTILLVVVLWAAFRVIAPCLFLGPIALYLSRELVKILHRDTHDASADQPALPPAGVIGGEAAPQV